MGSALVVAAVKYGLLALLWLFVVVALHVVGVADRGVAPRSAADLVAQLDEARQAGGEQACPAVQGDELPGRG